tara:strand:+ start:261 stop:785 length:525 start_codon:yes stop_codon:yes gene_type:complete
MIDLFGNEIKTIFIDGIELKPLHRFGIEIPDYYVSKCGKIWSSKTNKWKAVFENWRQKKGVGKPKCYDFSVTTPAQPFRDLGMKYTKKSTTKDTAEFRVKLHQAVKTVWHPLKDYSHEIGISKEEWNQAPKPFRQLAYDTVLIDHKDDDVKNNHLDNLQYSTPLKNSNYRKLWG